MKQTIYAVIGTGDDDTIVAMGDSFETQKPLVCQTEALLPHFISTAESISKRTGKEIVVAKFTLEKVLERFDGKQ